MDELLDLTTEEIDNIINAPSEEEKITIENWNNYKNNINMQITNMWNFMLYNQFNNEEIRRLHQEKERLDRTIKRLNENNNKLYDDNCDMKKKLEKTARAA